MLGVSSNVVGSSLNAKSWQKTPNEAPLPDDECAGIPLQNRTLNSPIKPAPGLSHAPSMATSTGPVAKQVAAAVVHSWTDLGPAASLRLSSFARENFCFGNSLYQEAERGF